MDDERACTNSSTAHKYSELKNFVFEPAGEICFTIAHATRPPGVGEFRSAAKTFGTARVDWSARNGPVTHADYYQHLNDRGRRKVLSRQFVAGPALAGSVVPILRL